MNAPQGIAALGTPQPQPGVAPPTQGAQPQAPDPTAPQQGGAVPPWVVLAMKQQALKLQAAQNQLAMQQQQQSTVAQQIAQQEAQMLQQQRPPMPPQAPAQPPQGIAMAARGGVIERGGVDRLPSNLRMAGGGIVGFSGEDGSVVNSPEAAQLEQDRSALMTGLKKFGYAAADIAAMPPRAASALLNSLLVRPARAVSGQDLPYFPMLGGEPGSLTPFTDRAYKEANPEKQADVSATKEVLRGRPTMQNDPRIVTPQAAGADAAQRTPGGSGRQGSSAIRTATAAPASSAVKNRLEELADEIKAAHAAGNPEKAYALSQERSKLMDGGDAYMSAMKTIMEKQEKLAAPGERGILDKLIPLLRGGAMSAPGADWSQVLSGGAVGSIDHEAKLKAEQKKAQEELLKMQGQYAGTQYTMTSGRHGAGLTAEKEANAAKRQQLGDRVQIEGALEKSNMDNRKFDQDAAQHKDTMGLRWSEIKARAAEHKDNKTQSEARQLETNMRTNATNRAAAEQKALGIAYDPVDIQARAEVILAREMQNSVQFKALMAKLGMPIPEASKAGAGGTRIKMDAQGNIIK